MHRNSGVLAASALLLAGCGGAATDDRNADSISVTSQSASAASGPAPAETRGQEFVAAVLGGYAVLVDSARLADERAERTETKRFTQAVAAELGASLDRLKVAAGDLRTEELADPSNQGDLTALSSARGAPFDRPYAEQQVESLTQLVGLIRAYKNGGDNPALKAWAEADQAVVNDLLLDAQTLSATLQEAAGR